MSTDLSLDPIEIIRLYGLRYKIEVGFKQAVRTIGSYTYHFWMKNMKPLNRYQGRQYLHRKTESYRNQVIRKINAYHLFVHAGIVAQLCFNTSPSHSLSSFGIHLVLGEPSDPGFLLRKWSPQWP